MEVFHHLHISQKFVRDMAAEKCDPSFTVRLTESNEKLSGSRFNRHPISVNKTEVKQTPGRSDRQSQNGNCPLHVKSSHKEKWSLSQVFKYHYSQSKGLQRPNQLCRVWQ